MSLGERVASDRQLARLLQIGAVLEEVVEARARRHLERLSEEDEQLRTLLTGAAREAADHRDRLEALIEDLEADTVPYERVESLVRESYAASSPEDFDGLLYDHLCNEETAYKFYDDTIAAIEGSETEFAVDRSRVLETLRGLRADEEAGVERVTEVMERR
jgi:rubrerythrin